MPIYEYECQQCRHYLDALQKLGEAPLTRCPACGHDTLRRLLSAPRFRLKGSGWYETDFKNDKRRNLADADSANPKPAKDDKKAATDGASTKPTTAPAAET